jgi:predicted GTPase
MGFMARRTGAGGNWRLWIPGGIVPRDKELIPREILRQTHVAIKKAVLLVMVDSHAGVTPLDRELA